VATASAAEGLRRCGWRIVAVNVSPGRMVRDVAYYWRRITRTMSGLGRAAWHGRKPPELVYAGVSGGWGLLFDAVLVRFLTGRHHERVLIHHNSFQYVDRVSIWMRFLIRIVPPESTHLVLCDHMRTEFIRIYGVSDDRVLVVGNLALRLLAGEKVSSATSGSVRSKCLRIGFLGTLSVEKGFELFLRIADQLDSDPACPDVEFVCAGPIGDRRTRGSVESLSHVNYLGVLTGEGVAEFLGDVDLVLFPSLYVNEAQPNVIIESLAAGVPALCTPRGCTVDLLTPHLSELIADEVEFIDAASRLIADMSQSESYVDELRQRAHLQFREISSDSARQAMVLQQLFS
jgi:glycosyltransferase involved in cell wall biosynthesis